LQNWNVLEMDELSADNRRNPMLATHHRKIGVALSEAIRLTK
jgi:hypothetical protein